MASFCPDKGIKGIKPKYKNLTKYGSSDFEECLENFLEFDRINSESLQGDDLNYPESRARWGLAESSGDFFGVSKVRKRKLIGVRTILLCRSENKF
jgi:hypothetical protein